MLKIWKDTYELDALRNKHVLICTEYVRQQIIQVRSSQASLGLNIDDDQFLTKLLDYLDYTDLNLISLLSDRTCILQKHNDVIGEIPTPNPKGDKKLKKALESIFNYDCFCKQGFPYPGFTNWNAYDLVQDIDLKTCPYCNENYLTLVYNSSKGLRPELDHFLPKSKYPWLALSFYNLIPVCHTCNSIKRTTEFAYNPYEESYQDKVRFEVKYIGDFYPTKSNRIDVFDIEFKTKNNKISKQITKLKIEDRYKFHKDIVIDIYRAEVLYNEVYVKGILNTIPDIGKLEEEDIFRMLFNTSKSIDKYHERPFSKFVNDIRKQIK